MNRNPISVILDSKREAEARVTSAGQVPVRYGWPRVTDEQRALDVQLRREQAEARCEANDAIRDMGRAWTSGSRLDQQELQIPLPAPPNFEQVIGHAGVARYVGLYWGAGEECYLDDGRTVCTGEVDAFAAYTRHWSIAPALCGACLGSSANDATHWLVLDRFQCQITLSLVEDAQRLLQRQWGKPEQEQVLVVEQGEWAVLVKELEARMSQIHPDLLAWEMQHQAQVLEMITWLDERERGQLHGKS